MALKYICESCKKVQYTTMCRRVGETITTETYKCTCKVCEFINNVVIYKPEQMKLPFPHENPNRKGG